MLAWHGTQSDDHTCAVIAGSITSKASTMHEAYLTPVDSLVWRRPHWILHLLARLTSISEPALVWRLRVGESSLATSSERWSRDDGDDVCFALTISRSVRMLGRRALAVTAPYAAVVASLSRRRKVIRRRLPQGLDVTTYDGWTYTAHPRLLRLWFLSRFSRNYLPTLVLTAVFFSVFPHDISTRAQLPHRKCVMPNVLWYADIFGLEVYNRIQKIMCFR